MRSGVGAACPFTLCVFPGFLLELFPDFEPDAPGVEVFTLLLPVRLEVGEVVLEWLCEEEVLETFL